MKFEPGKLNIPFQKEISLDDIQANILIANGREHVWCLFIQFQNNQKAIRDWISALDITSADKQYKDILIRRQENARHDGGMITCFFLSGAGYRILGFQENDMPKDESFRKGMKHGMINSALNDRPSGYWDVEYQREIHAMILLADNDDVLLEQQTKIFEDELEQSQILKYCFIEKGNKLRLGNFEVEHFGFRDGISQPKFWDESYQLLPEMWKLALYEESLSLGRYGSFLVYRKLEQNVKKFREKIHALAGKLGRTEDQAGALVMGRTKGGAPLSLVNETKRQEQDINIFNYENDAQGNICPFHAHIRKANPRNATLQPGHQGRIVRRGITYYEHRESDLSDAPESGAGMLFICYQASIEKQFEYIQKNWLNNPNFPAPDGAPAGIDPIAGRLIVGDRSIRWSIDQQDKSKMDFDGVIKLMGGEYFYAPSISFLNNLKHGIKMVSYRRDKLNYNPLMPVNPYTRS